jgi:DNA-binding LacI/PurR family transcriptional regulator
LAPGHRYLTGPESARLLGTSVATANRAMQILAEQNLVTRRRSSGTFVGPAAAAEAAADIRSVCVLAPASDKAFGTIKLDPLIESVVANMPDVAEVRLSYVPSDGDVQFVQHLLDKAPRVEGVVAISCSFEVYQYLGQRGCPLVVMGSLYPGQTYPSIDTDEHQAGNLLARYLIDRGHRRLLMISNSEACPGDHYFHDGVSEALTAANMPHNSLVLRAPGTSRAVLEAQVQEVLKMEDRPTGIIVRLSRWAEEVAEVVRGQGVRVPQDVEIVFKGYDWKEAAGLGFAHVRPCVCYEEIAGQVGKILAQARQGLPIAQSVVIPYQMCGQRIDLPSADGSNR